MKIVFVIFLSILFFSCNTKRKQVQIKDEIETNFPLQDRMDFAWQQEKEMTMDLSTGAVPTERLLVAYEQSKASTNKFSDGIEAVIPNFNWVELGPKNNGGRTRSICVDLNDATGKTVFAGSVGGGLWKTTDITAVAPNWFPVNDFFGNIAITAIAQDPLNAQNIYFSTGEGYGNADQIRGLGVWKTADGGTTWNQLSATNNSSFYQTFKMVVSNSGALFVGATNGLYKSTDGGTSFTRVLGTTKCYDIEIAANGHMFTSFSGAVYKSTDAGTTWSAPLPIGITASRIEIAIAPSDANTLYVLCESGNAVSGIAVSNNGGASFTTKTEPVDADPGIPSTDFSRGQAWYDLTIVVDPIDANVIFVGGIDIFKSTDAGSNWQQISHWYGGFGFQDVHSDQHNIIFSPGSSTVAYFMNDGSIYRTTNANASIPTLTNKEINYNTSQFYACAMTPTTGTYDFLAGAQDNGTHKFSVNGIGNSVYVTGGDGMFCHIDQDQPLFWFSSYVFNNYYRSTNGGASFSTVGGGSNTGRFVNPTDYDDKANILYCAGASNEYRRLDNANTTGNALTIVPLAALGGQISGIKVSPNSDNRVFMGINGGVLLRVDNANTGSPAATNIATGLPSGYISSIEVETGNDNHLLVTFSNYGINSIWESINGGASWTSIEGNLPDMPIRWALFNPNNANQACIATELGVWSTDLINGSSTVWGASNTGLANVRVNMLQVRQSDKLIIAATHGRGLFYSGVFAATAANFNVASQVIYSQRELLFSNTSFNSSSYVWDFNDGTTSTLASPLKKFINPGTYNVSLSVNGGVSTKVKTITVLPKKGTPYSPLFGGNFETNPGDFASLTINGTDWQRGNSIIFGKNGTNSGLNAWVTGLTSNYLDNSESYLFGPNFNFSTPGTYNFSFYTKYTVEDGYDGLMVEYSIDTGKVWIALGNSVQTNWYNFANTSSGAAFPVNQAFFSGSVVNYTKSNYDVSFLAGNANVAFRFVFKSDGSVNAAGVAIDDVEITSPVNVLPLRFINFAATKQEKNAKLIWKTSNELNINYFVIERSWNGIDFTDIGTVNAQSTNGNVYSFVDPLTNFSTLPSNTTFYRIKAIDFNNSFKRTNIEQLKWNDSKSDFTLYPNPFSTYFEINTRLNILKVALIAYSGQIVYAINKLESNKVLLPPFIASGTYILRLQTENGFLYEKVIKK